jgi:hypothetical protein
MSPAVGWREDTEERTLEASTDIVRAVEQRLQDIESQLSSYDDLVRERDRLRRALHELRTDATGAPAAGGARAGSGRRGTRRRGSGRRAQRGSNVRAIVDYVGANPGSTAAEIAVGTGIDRSVVYSATSRLASAGRLRRAPKGDRQVGYEAADGGASSGG